VHITCTNIEGKRIKLPREMKANSKACALFVIHFTINNQPTIMVNTFGGTSQLCVKSCTRPEKKDVKCRCSMLHSQITIELLSHRLFLHHRVLLRSMESSAAASIDVTDKFEIQSYLRHKTTRNCTPVGVCRKCNTLVQWRRINVVNHFVHTCTQVGLGEKRQWKHFQGLEKRKSHVLSSDDATLLQSTDGLSTLSSKSNNTCTSLSIASRPLKVPKQGKLGSFVDTMLPSQQIELEGAVADFFYRTAIPFNAAQCNEYKKMWKIARPTFKPPSSRKIGGSLLDYKYEELTEKMRKKIDEADIIVIASDGWSNLRNDHLVNYIVISPGVNKPIFYDAVDTKSIRQTSVAVADELLRVIDEVGGPRKVTAVVTDNAPVMKAAWDIIKRKYPTIFGNGCVAHILNLLVQDICNLEHNMSILEKAVSISKFVKRRGQVARQFQTLQRSTKFSQFVCLPVETRWYTQYQCMLRVLRNRTVLEQLAASTSLMRAHRGEPCETFKATIVNADFWTELEELVDILQLPSELIGKAENDSSVISDVYGYFQSLQSNPVYKDLPEITRLVNKRWKCIQTNLVGMSAILDPSKQGGIKMADADQVDAIQELKAHLKQNFEFYNVNNLIDVQRDGAETVDAKINNAVESEVMNYVAFAAEPGCALQPTITCSGYLPRQWWIVYGRGKFPLIYQIARRVFSIPTSSASSERVWSVFNLIHTKKRNQLKNEKVIKLAYVYINSNLGNGMDTDSSEAQCTIDYCQQQLDADYFSRFMEENEGIDDLDD
jgi:hypothetical protein